jgi:hypothetical protein
VADEGISTHGYLQMHCRGAQGTTAAQATGDEVGDSVVRLRSTSVLAQRIPSNAPDGSSQVRGRRSHSKFVQQQHAVVLSEPQKRFFAALQRCCERERLPKKMAILSFCILGNTLLLAILACYVGYDTAEHFREIPITSTVIAVLAVGSEWLLLVHGLLASTAFELYFCEAAAKLNVEALEQVSEEASEFERFEQAVADALRECPSWQPRGPTMDYGEFFELVKLATQEANMALSYERATRQLTQRMWMHLEVEIGRRKRRKKLQAEAVREGRASAQSMSMGRTTSRTMPPSPGRTASSSRARSRWARAVAGASTMRRAGARSASAVLSGALESEDVMSFFVVPSAEGGGGGTAGGGTGVAMTGLTSSDMGGARNPMIPLTHSGLRLDPPISLDLVNPPVRPSSASSKKQPSDPEQEQAVV